MDIFGEHVDEKRDMPTVRAYPAPKGPDFLAKVVDPYGFWRIHREKGQIPAELSGDYTSLPLAEAAIKSYIQRMKG